MDQQSHTNQKREHYSVEIRNQNRQALFKTKRQLQTQDIETDKPITNQYDDIAQINPENLKESVLALVNQISGNPIPTLEKLKILVQQNHNIYQILISDALTILKIIVQLLQLKDAYLNYLAFYHALNIIYVMDDNYTEQQFYANQDFLSMYNLIKESTFMLITQGEIKYASYGLFTLANIYSNKNIYTFYPQLKQQQSQLIAQLQALTRQTTQQSASFTHGLLWLLANLCRIRPEPNVQIFDILEQQCELVAQYQNINNIGIQICDDFLIIMSSITRIQTEDEISDLFQSHIQLLVFLISNNWNPQVYENIALIIRNLLYGQDDVIEQLLGLGLSEVIYNLLTSNQEIVIEETLGSLSNVFCADDEDIIKLAISQIKLPIIQEILQRLTPGNALGIREEASNAMSQLLKNYPDVAEQVIKYKGVQCLLHSLSETNGVVELINNLLSILYTILQYEEQQTLDGYIRNEIINMGGQQLIAQYLDSTNELSLSLASQLIGLINAD